jgi:hypothetical protein
MPLEYRTNQGLPLSLPPPVGRSHAELPFSWQHSTRFGTDPIRYDLNLEMPRDCKLATTRLAADTVTMAKKPEPPKATTWKIYKIASKGAWLGEVDAPDEAAAIEKAAAEFKAPANRLMAIRAPRPPEPPDAAPTPVTRRRAGWWAKRVLGGKR